MSVATCLFVGMSVRMPVRPSDPFVNLFVFRFFPHHIRIYVFNNSEHIIIKVIGNLKKITVWDGQKIIYVFINPPHPQYH